MSKPSTPADPAAQTTETAALILLGAGGHATVLAEILQTGGAALLGLCAPRPPEPGLLDALDYLGGDEVIEQRTPGDIQLVNGLGSIASTTARAALFHRLRAAGYRFAAVCHPTAVVSPSAQTGEGLQALAGSLINSEARLGANVLVNSRAVVEHHCEIGDHVHVASGAILCGGCRLGAGVHVGAGAVVRQGLQIGAGAVVAAGAVVIDEVPPRSLVAGVPARIKREGL